MDWNDDGEALNHLYARGYRDNGGGILYPAEGHKEEPLDTSAINYLCAEWDYGFSGTKP